MSTTTRDLATLDRVAEEFHREDDLVVPSEFGFGQLGGGAVPPRKLPSPDAEEAFRRFVKSIPAATARIRTIDGPDLDDLQDATLAQAWNSARSFAGSLHA